jgi:hypothetical protein
MLLCRQMSLTIKAQYKLVAEMDIHGMKVKYQTRNLLKPDLFKTGKMQL